MFGSEFDFKRTNHEKRPYDEEETPSEDPDSYSDDGYTLRDSFEEPRSGTIKDASFGVKKNPKRSCAVYFLLFTCGLLVFTLLAPRGFYSGRLRRPWKDIGVEDVIEGSEDGAKVPLNVFQVYPPVRVGAEFLPESYEGRGNECSVMLMEHEFGWSYGKPFVGSYTPPKCRWTHVLFNLTMTSKGRQFDRLAMLFLGDVEVFRTSTAEPTQDGIIFNYMKDMTAYTTLLSQPQKLIFDLGNLVDSTYTGTFTATLTATFYTPPSTYPSRPPLHPTGPANQILPISSLSSTTDHPSHFLLPRDRATTAHTLPPNTIRATVSLSASGNADEEFWYTNVPNAYKHTFPGAPLPGASPFREVQLLINGDLAGVAWPFAEIYTGGINPALWRPIVGIAAYDVPEYTIDITPFLPLILGSPATFEIRVVTADPDEEIANDWIVSGRVFVWTDPSENWITTGALHHKSLDATAFSTTTKLTTEDGGNVNATLYHHITAQRALSFTATISTSAGPRAVVWSQGLSYANTNRVSAGGATQSVEQITQGSSAATGKANTFRWPLSVNTTFLVDPAHGNFTIWASIDRGVEERGDGGVFPRGGSMETRQNGTAVFMSGGGGAWGETEQRMAWTGTPSHSEGVGGYGRSVRAEAGRVVKDWEWVNELVVEKDLVVGSEGDEMVFVDEERSVRSFLGRGPG
ncbi:peptide N-acetyl-beta-D-glucosaminyl asparaginase amidase A-domain-containing protein [Morchella snyderi]|nr:peptide N-acetyl-beta-D-glucosaminyl asparaginase amidase A-domain-containing protein [Morchella snyderi]